MHPHIRLSENPRGALTVSTIAFAANTPVLSSEPPRKYLWNVVPGSAGWPHTDTSEAVFVNDLRSTAAGKDHGRVYRGDITMLLLALRNAATADTICEQFPGVSPERLVAAYDVLNNEIRRCSDAVTELLGNPSDETLNDLARVADRLMPAIVHQLESMPADTRPDYVNSFITAEQRVRADVNVLYSALDRLPSGCREGVEVGRLLFNGDLRALYDTTNFWPRRPGELSIDRVSRLLQGRAEAESRG